MSIVERNGWLTYYIMMQNISNVWDWNDKLEEADENRFLVIKSVVRDGAWLKEERRFLFPRRLKE
jgi:hypothetical protein